LAKPQAHVPGVVQGFVEPAELLLGQRALVDHVGLAGASSSDA